MKANLKSYLAVVLLMFVFSAVMAQEEQFDKVVKTNGEEMLGHVTEMGDDAIKFVHKGETLSYSLKKSEINKIQFASGRVEFFTEAPNASPTASAAAPVGNSVQSHHNMVAVLPFDYMGSGGSRDDKMGLKVQSDCYTYLRQKAALFTIQDPLTTNALLVKNNIQVDNLIGLTPGEMANLLGVEYVVYGSVVITQTGVTNSSANSYSSKSKGSRYNSTNFGSSTTSASFNTNVDLKIYNDQGQNVYANTHDSFWPDENAYEITLQYLIKRTPLYSK
ncbi:hypothetical protein [Algoriphagus chordae]|uniref:Uncharacterized protein n=1 Tax=Algoriphagus chordae TaxID=237019 RepID=A0A2W7S8K8_9BACT|nr:hypothetical protein [Algoriphagus chordae]PZX46922.1 hypothetical protein LV85_04146 [Algoriphagus chordae]